MTLRYRPIISVQLTPDEVERVAIALDHMHDGLQGGPIDSEQITLREKFHNYRLGCKDLGLLS